MDKFFCAEASRQVGEDIIGSGSIYQTYVLVECALPWVSEAFESKHVPQNLKNLEEEVKQSKLPVRFLLIADNQTKDKKHTKVLIYNKSKEGFSTGYSKQEFTVTNLEQVADLVRNYLNRNGYADKNNQSKIRDILVCTHGSHDMCCARYGNPFYMQALDAISELSLSNIRIWRASHFGGHRFAPTAIDFPDGRYYGVLDQPSFKSILTRSGDIECLNKVYRGWGILPNPVQVLERELIRRHGWDWFNYKVAGCIIEQTLDKSFVQAQLTFEKPDGSVLTYRADLVKDEEKSLQLKGSCGASKESKFIKYSVTNLRIASEEMVCLSA